MKSKKAKKQTNSFIRFLGEFAARQSAYSFIWPLDPTIIALMLLTFLPAISVMEENTQLDNQTIIQMTFIKILGYIVWDFFSRISTNLKFIFAEESWAY